MGSQPLKINLSSKNKQETIKKEVFGARCHGNRENHRQTIKFLKKNFTVIIST